MAKNKSFLNNTSTPIDSVPFDSATSDFIGWLKNNAANNSQLDTYKSKNLFYGDFIAQIFPDGLAAAGNMFFDPLLASIKISEETIQQENFEPFISVVNIPAITHIETPPFAGPGEPGHDEYVQKVKDIVANLGVFKSYDYLGETPTYGAKVAVSFGDPSTLTDPIFEFPLAGAGFDAVARRLAASGHFATCGEKGVTGRGLNGHKFSERGLLARLERVDKNFPVSILKQISSELNCDISLLRGFLSVESGGRAPKANNWNGEADYNKMPHFLFMVRNHWTRKYINFKGNPPNVTWANKDHTNSTKNWAEARRLWKMGAFANTSWGIWQIHPWYNVPKSLGYKNSIDCAIGMTASLEAQVDAIIKFIKVHKVTNKPASKKSPYSPGQFLLKAMQAKDWCWIGRYYNGQTIAKCAYGARMQAIHDLDKKRQTGSQVSVPNTTTEEAPSVAKAGKTETSKNEDKPQKPNDADIANQTPNVETTVVEVKKRNPSAEEVEAAANKAKGSGGANGKVVYIYGDSNTNANKGAVLAWAKKNYPGSGISWQAVSGRRAVGDPSSNLNGPSKNAKTGLVPLTKLSPQKAAAVVFGSCGGNDASSAKANKNTLKPGGTWDQELEKLFTKLASLQSGGTTVIVLGLPYGQDATKGGDNSDLTKRRRAMDKACIAKAQKYSVNYISVFDQTRKIKLAAVAQGKKMTGGYKVHYYYDGEKTAYRNLVLDLLPGQRPTEEEIKKGRRIKTVEKVGANNTLEEKC